MRVHPVVGASVLVALVGCGEPAVSVPDTPPFSELWSDLDFGTAAAKIATRPGIAVNDDGQYVEYVLSKDWLYLFEPYRDTLPPNPTDRLVAVQVAEPLGDTLALWPRWHAARRSLGTELGQDPVCVVTGGPLFRVTRAEFAGSPAISVGAEIDFEEDGQAYEARLIVAAAEITDPSDLDRGFPRERIDCEAPPGGVL